MLLARRNRGQKNITYTRHNLKSLVGKKVSLTTIGGKTLTGIVKEVGSHMIHLEKIEGKEFYDALILIDTIGTVEAMFRNYQS